jgi:hypothetical protein
VIIANMRIFPEGGTFPFTTSDIVQTVLVSVLALALLPRRAQYVRVGLLLYIAACLVLTVIPSPMGANATRLSTLFVVPMLIAFAADAHKLAVLGVLAFALVWQWEAPVRDMVILHSDPSVHADYYKPVMRQLSRLEANGPFRVEIPATANHWEAVYVGARFPLARGWERQLDRKYDALFYDGNLTAQRYDDWLRRNGVEYVAVPSLPLRRFDFAARDEVALVRSGTNSLTPVWESRNWRIFRVVNGTGLATGPGRVTALSVNEFDLRFDRPGSLFVRIHWSPNLRVVKGDACLAPTPTGWTNVTAPRGGAIRIGAGVDVADALEGGGPACASASGR